ncbi:hypothetical protein D0D70_18185 [Vibrio parahaemolyticus]|nr:hypothetical protein [Vibrio parahaemolyticus]
MPVINYDYRCYNAKLGEIMANVKTIHKGLGIHVRSQRLIIYSVIVLQGDFSTTPCISYSSINTLYAVSIADLKSISLSMSPFRIVVLAIKKPSSSNSILLLPFKK